MRNRRRRLSKVVFLVLVVILVYWLLKAYRKGIDRRADPQKTITGEDMVRCDHCGVHLPRSESVTTRGRYFCSTEHQRQHLQAD